MLFRWRSKADPIATRFSNGWTDEMLKAMLGSRIPTRDELSREAAHVDRTIYLLGFGQAINKFEVQRMLWGWVTPTYGHGVIAPAFVRVEVFETEDRAAYRDDDGQFVPEPDATADYLEREMPARATKRQRHQVGHALLHGEGGGHSKAPAEEQLGMTPFFDVRLQLTRAEWEPLRECLEMSRWRDGRGPSLSVRMEMPDDLDRDALRLAPWRQTFPITRFWVESVVALGAGLDTHPLFKSAIADGGISQLF